MAIIKCPRCGQLKEVFMKPNLWVCEQTTPSQVTKKNLCEECEMALDKFMHELEGGKK